MQKFKTPIIFGMLLVAGLSGLWGCAGPKTEIWLVRKGSMGLEEQYAVRSDDSAFKLVRMPGDSLKTAKQGALAGGPVDSLFLFVRNDRPVFDSLNLTTDADLVTSIRIVDPTHQTIVLWPNLDPPRLQTSALDSLYRKMLYFEARISQFSDLQK